LAFSLTDVQILKITPLTPRINLPAAKAVVNTLAPADTIRMNSYKAVRVHNLPLRSTLPHKTTDRNAGTA